jgi:hypothetical protein
MIKTETRARYVVVIGYPHYLNRQVLHTYNSSQANRVLAPETN